MLFLLLLASADVRFNRDVRPILSAKCFKCHGPDLKKGKLDLQTFAAATKGKAVVPGDPAASTLLERVTAHEESERMPPRGEPLTKEQVATLRAWIEQGAR